MSTLTFTAPEGLRHLLHHLEAHPDEWCHGVEAELLMTHVMEKYGALARKHGLEPTDAAMAAFEALRTKAVREADDPWAVVTHAVQLTMIYQARADGLLCSTSRARRGDIGGFHDAERFCDREVPLYEHHQRFQTDFDYGAVSGMDDTVIGPEGEPKNALMALDDAVEIFEELGWPPDVARNGVEYVCARLMSSKTRPNAFEYLRRDHYVCALLDIDQSCWVTMLRALLGNQHQDRACTNAGRGVLLLLLIGCNADDIVAMPDIVATITRGARAFTGGGRRG